MKVTLTPEPNTERTDMTELSADLAPADSEARESRERVRFEAFISASDDFTHWQLWCAALAPAVPPGFVLVPVEPTNAMWDAAVLEENRISRDFPGQHPSCFQIWKSMVSAASSAKEPTCPKN